MAVRRATHGDEERLRDVRLRALVDSPEAFSSTLERELARTTEDWQAWIDRGATFLLPAPDDARADGLVGCFPDDDHPDRVVWLMAMWVGPERRGDGGAVALVDALLAWARTGPWREVRLHVVRDNARARGFYEKLGFVPTGAVITNEHCLDELEMARPLP